MGETIAVNENVIQASLGEAKQHSIKEETARETINNLIQDLTLVPFSDKVLAGLKDGTLDAKHRICVDERPDLPRMAWLLYTGGKLTLEKYQEITEAYNEKNETDKEQYANDFYENNQQDIDTRPWQKENQEEDKEEDNQNNSGNHQSDEKENPYKTKKVIALPQNTGSLYKAIHQTLTGDGENTYANIYQHFKTTNSSLGKVSANILGQMTNKTFVAHGSTHGHDDCGAAKTDDNNHLKEKGNSQQSNDDYKKFVLNNKKIFSPADHQTLIGDHKPEGAVVFNDTIENILTQAEDGTVYSLHHQTLEHAYFVYDGIAVKYLLYQMLIKTMKNKMSDDNGEILQEIKDFTDAVGNKIADYYGHLGGHLSENIIPAMSINTKNEVTHIGRIGGSGEDTTIEEKH